MPARKACFSLCCCFAAVAVLSSGAWAQRPTKPATPPSGAYVVGGQQANQLPSQDLPHWTLAPLNKRLPNPAPAQIQTIIQTFATHELEFRQLLAHNYTYTESVLVQSLDGDGNPTGSYQQTNNIVYLPGAGGGRQIVCTYCPQPNLQAVSITQDDINDMFDMNMYTFSADELPQYNVTYLDHQPLDEITAFVFRIQPKHIVKGQRYFDGVVFVDDHSLMIVKSIGRVVPNQRDKHGNLTNVFLPFTVWRKEVDGKYWFPAYTLMQGEIPPMNGSVVPVPMRMVLQFTNYKRFGATSRILSVQALPDQKKPDTKPKPKPGDGIPH